MRIKLHNHHPPRHAELPGSLSVPSARGYELPKKRLGERTNRASELHSVGKSARLLNVPRVMSSVRVCSEDGTPPDLGTELKLHERLVPREPLVHCRHQRATSTITRCEKGFEFDIQGYETMTILYTDGVTSQ